MIELDEWQKEVLAQEGDLLLCTGRRVGKTYIMSRKAVDFMVDKRKPVIVVSLTEDQAMLIIAMALAYAREAYPKLIGRGRNKPTLKSLTIMVDKKPVKMISRPVGNTGDAIRGFEGGVLVVDEASRMPKLFWIAAKPVLLTQAGQIWLASTPFGKQGYFWDRYNEAVNFKLENARFKVYHITTEEVMRNRPISDGWTAEQQKGAIELLETEKREMSALEYGQEYQGLFLDELRQFFSDDLIDNALTLKNTSITDGQYYLGVDVARMGGDEFVEFALKKIEDKRLEELYMTTFKNLTIPEGANKIIFSDGVYNFTKIYIDDGGLGVGTFDLLRQNDKTKRKVEAINNKSRPLDHLNERYKKILKEDLYVNLLRLMEQGKIKLKNNDYTRRSLKSIQYEYHENKMRIFGNYTHITEALIRAAWCMSEKKLKPFIY